MTTQAWFRWSLLLPVLVPVFCLPLAATGEHGRALVWMLFVPLVFGGLPYVPFAAGMGFAVGRLSRRRAILLAWLSPLVFAVMEGIFVALAVGGSRDAWPAIPLMAGFALAYGYLYVILATVLYGMLKAWGAITPDPVRGPEVV
jgi:hypothetical protein